MIWEFIISAAMGAAAPMDCAAPTWFRSEALRIGLPKEDMIGFGKDRDVDQAAREARRDLGAQIVKRYGDEILADARVKKGVNVKAFARAEVISAMPNAAAADLKGLTRLRGETVCGVRYLAYAVSKVKALDALLKDAPDFPQHVNMALMGKIDEVEKDLVADEPRPAATRRGADLGGADLTLSRLKKAAEGLDKTAFVDGQLRESAVSRAEKLSAALATARGIEWDDKRGPAVAEAQDMARKHEIFLSAVKDYRAENFLAAFDAFMNLARGGDIAAQFVVGVMYFEGQGQRKNLKESYDWFRRAAAQNHGPSKMMVGLFYFSGYGVKVNHAEAFKWFNSAAQQGWACEAQFNACRRVPQMP